MNEEASSSGGFLSNKQYDAVKYLTIVVLPSCGTLYFALAQIWGLPAGEQVLGTILAVETFIGVVLGISTNQYEKSGARYDGAIVKSQTGDKTVASLEFDEHPEDVLKKDEVTLKVKSS